MGYSDVVRPRPKQPQPTSLAPLLETTVVATSQPQSVHRVLDKTLDAQRCLNIVPPTMPQAPTPSQSDVWMAAPQASKSGQNEAGPAAQQAVKLKPTQIIPTLD